MTGFEPLGEELIHEGPIFSVGVGQVRAPDGRVVTREYVRHPGAVVVVPIVGETQVVLVRQYRAVIDELLLELPAGKRDVSGEDPAVTAGRELQEEVGLVAGSLELLANFYNTPGFSDEYTFLYLATGCQPVSWSRQGVEEEHMSVERFELDDALDRITSGEIHDAKTIIGLLLARRRLGER